MINKIILKNFGSHIDSVLDLSSGVNIITGDNDAGKSTIFKALNLVVNNRPLGDGFINDNKEMASVIIEGENNDICYTIERTRNKKNKNIYVVDIDGDKTKFEAFGNSVPEEVKRLVNFSDINIQNQRSPFFLVYDSPGQVAAYIRDAVGLDEIDGVISIISSKIRQERGSKTQYETELEEIRKQLKKTDDIDINDLSEFVSDIESLCKETNRIGCECDELENIISKLNGVNSELFSLPHNIDQTLEIVTKTIDVYNTTSTKINALDDILTSITNINKQIFEFSDDIENIITTSKKIYNECESVQLMFLNLSSCVSEINNVSYNIKNMNDMIKTLRNNEATLLNNVENCPSCGSKLNKQTKKVLLDGLKDEC